MAELANFSAVDSLLNSFVSSQVFPGATAIIADRTGWLHTVAVGQTTYEKSSQAVSLHDTLFDLASLTKVTATTTAAMLLYQWGVLKLSGNVTTLFGPAFAAVDHRKALMTVADLLTHSAGLPPDPTPVSFCTPQFACPETVAHRASERKLVFSCRSQALAAIIEQPLDRPPATKFVYSDMSMLALMFIVGHLARPFVSPNLLLSECMEAYDNRGHGVSGKADIVSGVDQCYYEAFCRQYIFEPLLMRRNRSKSGVHRIGNQGRFTPFLGFTPPRNLWQRAAPTWNDTWQGFPGECIQPYRDRVLQGEVSDGNAFALGGIAGHAGVFGSAPELSQLLHQLLFAPSSSGTRKSGVLGINSTTAQLFTTVRNASFSSRALGWDTNQPGGYLGCGNLSASTFTHTGCKTSMKFERNALHHFMSHMRTTVL